MASMRERNGRWQVRWRQDGHARAETVAGRGDARRFQGLVMAAGERCPDGWVPGHGFVPAPRQQAAAEATGPTLGEWFDRAVAVRTTANERAEGRSTTWSRLWADVWVLIW